MCYYMLKERRKTDCRQSLCTHNCTPTNYSKTIITLHCWVLSLGGLDGKEVDRFTWGEHPNSHTEDKAVITDFRGKERTRMYNGGV